MKTTEEYLKAKGITTATSHHDYQYLYKAVIQAMRQMADEYRKEASQEEAKERYGKAYKYFLYSAMRQSHLKKALRIAAGLPPQPNKSK